MSQITQQKLIENYRWAHEHTGYFTGTAIKGRVEDIGNVIRETDSKTLLDYGCGKGVYYLQHKIHEKWGVEKPVFYDPGVKQWDTKPKSKFDGVLCIDVMEHILDPEAVLPEIVGYATKFCYFAISCQHSAPHKKFPDGTPFHVFVKPPSWWREKLEPYQKSMRIELRFDVPG